MITRFYVDNYKSLVNFEYKPKPFELILGPNGTGKTTVFEALRCLQDLVLRGKTVEEVFPYSSLTRWQKREEMTLELEMKIGGFDYKYELRLKIGEFSSSIQSEILHRSGVKLFESTLVTELVEEEWGGEMLATFTQVKYYVGKEERSFNSPEHDVSNLKRYSNRWKDELEKIVFMKLQPTSMTNFVTVSERRPNISLDNFAAYYLHLIQEKQGLIFDLLPILRENLAGFRSFVLIEVGKETRRLRVEFTVEGGKKGQTIHYDFDELSDGQRALIALYTVAFCESDSTLFIDEPENFVSSRELQPWLMLLRERIEDFGGQAILISHHPEFINVMAPQDAIQFRRVNGGPVQIRPFETAQYEGLTPAEIVARGWENE